MGSDGTLVLPYGALLYIKTRIMEQLFAESGKLLYRKLRHEQLLRVATVTGVASGVFDFLHTLDIPLLVDAQITTHAQRVHSHLLAHHHHDVISRLIVHQELPLTVAYGTTGRILHPMIESVAVGLHAKILAHKLQIQKSAHIDRHNAHRDGCQHPLPALEVKVFFF